MMIPSKRSGLNKTILKGSLQGVFRLLYGWRVSAHSSTVSSRTFFLRGPCSISCRRLGLALAHLLNAPPPRSYLLLFHHHSCQFVKQSHRVPLIDFPLPTFRSASSTLSSITSTALVSSSSTPVIRSSATPLSKRRHKRFPTIYINRTQPISLSSSPKLTNQLGFIKIL